MRVGFIGCVQFSQAALETLLNISILEVCAVVTRKQSVVNADFCDLSKLCKQYDIPVHFEYPNKQALSIEFLQKYNLDIIYCIGWSYLLSENLLSLTPMGIIGFHPAKLPQNRGRHPIIWALVLGLDKTASTFFKMEQTVDSGPILSQKTVIISADDNAQLLYNKILTVAKQQIREFTPRLASRTAVFIEQNHSKATYWRKRSRQDGRIDFRMSVTAIHNLIRALTAPYLCAEFAFNEQPIKVSGSRPVKGIFAKNIEPGKVLEKHNNKLLVKVEGKDAIWLENICSNNIRVGDCL